MSMYGEPPARQPNDGQTQPYSGPIVGADGSDANDDAQPLDRPQTPAVTPSYVAPEPVLLLQTRTVDENEEIEWRDPEPLDPRDRAEHPKFSAEWQTLGPNWTIAAVSSRGISHRKGKYRDDDFAIKLFSQRTAPPASSWSLKNKRAPKPSQASDSPYATLIAIADGLGSRQFSRRGARAAVQGAIRISEDHMRNLYALLERGESPERLHIQAGKALREAFDLAAQAVEKRAKADRLSVELLHSTLIIIIAIPNPHHADQMVVITSQVGDGAIYTVDWTPQAPHDQWNWLLKPQVESTGTQVTPFMTRYESDKNRLVDDMAPIQREEALTCLLAMTDGAADPLIPYDPAAAGGDYAHIQPFYADVCAILREVAPQPQAERTVAFRRRMVAIFNKKLGSDDDITLVCLFNNRLLATAQAGD